MMRQCQLTVFTEQLVELCHSCFCLVRAHDLQLNSHGDQMGFYEDKSPGSEPLWLSSDCDPPCKARVIGPQECAQNPFRGSLRVPGAKQFPDPKV